MKIPYSEPFKIKTVEAIKKTIRSEREQLIKAAHFNLFNLRSENVYIDLLTDSGTGAMSDRQWSKMMVADESYAGARSFYNLKEAVSRITGFEFVLPTHQGRAAENVLFSVMVKEGDVVPGNSHFDTTKGHIEFRRARAVDCTINEAMNPTLNHPFKGNIDLGKLEAVFKKYPKEKIPMVIVTMTCNSSGGQPISLANLKSVSQLCLSYGIRLIIDGARFAENAYFIKIREDGNRDKSIKEIALELFSHSDGMTMSSKKDAIVNMGGFIALRDGDLYNKACTYNIMFEGYITYGGMSGRDMEALAQGLDEGSEADYLESRIRQVNVLGELLRDAGVPILEPPGGHAIYVDAKRFFSHIPRDQFPGQLLGVEAYIEGGIRGTEIGTLMADRDPKTRENRFPELELYRMAVPRRVYSDNHMRVVAACLANLYKRAPAIKRGLKIESEAPIMRHFTVKLDRN